jgi:protein transport protein SEC24
VRSQALSSIYIYPTEMALTVLYPKFYPLHMLPSESGKPGPDGQIVMPPMMNLTAERMERHGCYLLDNGNEVFLWISRGVSLELLQSIFDNPNYDSIPLGKVRIL